LFCELLPGVSAGRTHGAFQYHPEPDCEGKADTMLIKLLAILVLILLNGFFAMSELAVVSSRRARLQGMAEQRRRGAVAALRLLDDPSRFLSSVQVGISLTGVLAGAFGGAALAGPLAAWMVTAFPALAAVANAVAFIVVVGGITYLSLIIGELVPKQIALHDAERIACAVAPGMTLIARIASPLVWVLDASSQLILRLLRRGSRTHAGVSDEEIHLVLREAAQAGVVEHAEREMIAGVMRLADRPVGGIMTPRPDVEWIDIEDSDDEIRDTLRQTSYSRLLVCAGDIDEVLGVVQAKDLLNRSLQGQPFDLRAALRHATAVPETMSALNTLGLLRRAPVRIALVVDEYGSLMGVVTAADILKVIVGGLHESGNQLERRAVRRTDGSWLMDGGIALDEASAMLRLRELRADEGYHTLAGWMLARLDYLPQVGERMVWNDWTFEVVDMDGYRIDKILITPPPGRESFDEG
jgi:putative hemolysin